MTHPLHYKLKADRIDTFATFADFNRLLSHFIAMQNKRAADDLIYNFACGVEPVRRVALEDR